MAANSNWKPQNELLEPCILACGYRQISIVKTNNKFPAWLVLIPSPDNTCWGEVISPNEDSMDDSAPQWSCYWRSKRDFLLLSRSLAASGSNNEKIQSSCSGPRLKLRTLPKAPFQKLCDRSPWRRPLLVNNSLAKDTNRDTLQECLMNPVVLDEVWKKPKNEYHASMTKNLFQMDQFLQAIHRHTSCVSDKCGCVVGVQKTSGEEDTTEAFQKAWKLFCRPLDCEEIVATSENNSLLEPLGSSLPTPQSLGQYFCTPENSTQVRLSHQKSDSGIENWNESNESSHLLYGLFLAVPSKLTLFVAVALFTAYIAYWDYAEKTFTATSLAFSEEEAFGHFRAKLWPWKYYLGSSRAATRPFTETLQHRQHRWH